MVERQVAALRKENQQLKQQLGTLINNAKQNDALLEKVKVLILALAECKSNADIKTQIESLVVDEFGSCACKLWLLVDVASTQQLSHSQANKKLARFTEKEQTYCGLLRAQEQTLLFAEQAEQVGSAAVLSLRKDGQPIALLSLIHI